MSRYHSYINSARELLEKYTGEEPLAAFLKKFFSLKKKFGSTDRKMISHLCYCYFRTGKLKLNSDVEERILLGQFLCTTGPNDFLKDFNHAWNNSASLPMYEKLILAGAENDWESIFPFNEELSSGIEKKTFIISHLQQPDLFLRLRPGKQQLVKNKLNEAGINYSDISPNCLSLPNASKIDKLIEFNKEVTVQDYSSQRVGEFVLTLIPEHTEAIVPGSYTVWDCCAGSGGKSIMLYDLLPAIKLTVSDVRESILINLKKRFYEAGIKNYKSFEANLATKDQQSFNQRFQLIIADVPCSGSGTWGRTPEQLFYFQKNKIDHYTVLQKKILTNISTHLEDKGHILYVTCSVFKKENEEIIDFVLKNLPLKLIKMEVLNGYHKKADTMFVALLQNAS